MEEFRQEIDIQGMLHHPSIVGMIGIYPIWLLLITSGIILRPFCLVTEICPYGDLFTFIHNPENYMTWQLRIKIAGDIAKGLKYLQGLLTSNRIFNIG